jgi:prepilin-type N-terminal cleavage/methylation domain-containing protein
MRNREQGFSLIELLVVIAIIATLVGATTLVVRMANKAKAKQITNGRMLNLAAAIETLKQNDNMGFYPSADTSKLREQGKSGKNGAVGERQGNGNELNLGIETVLMACYLYNVPHKLEEAALGNTDDDELGEPIDGLTSNARFEVIDAYGNPFIYFSMKDYKEPGKAAQYMLGNGETIKVMPKKGKAGFLRPSEFQLFSLGADGKPDTDDDEVYAE